jgi:hypothetical protein
MKNTCACYPSTTKTTPMIAMAVESPTRLTRSISCDAARDKQPNVVGVWDGDRSKDTLQVVWLRPRLRGQQLPFRKRMYIQKMLRDRPECEMSYRCGTRNIPGVPNCRPHIVCDKCGAGRSVSKTNDTPYQWFLDRKKAPGWQMSINDNGQRIDTCTCCWQGESR